MNYQGLKENRPISDREAEIVIRMLRDASVVGSLEYLVDSVWTLRVVGRCSCGCSSVDFQDPHQPGNRLLADGMGNLESGEDVKITIWGRPDAIISLEILAERPGPTGLPLADSIRA